MAWSLEEAMKRTGVLKEGHFLLSSGCHSDRYLQCAQLLMHPADAEKTGQALAGKFQSVPVDLVAGPALGGVIIAHEVARTLNVPCVFAERKEGMMQLRRGFQVEPGQKVLVVEDVVTTGGSVNEVIRLLKDRNADVVAVGSIVDRTGGKNPFRQPYQALKRIEIPSFEPEDCPLCKKGIPVTKPGSRGNQN